MECPLCYQIKYVDKENIDSSYYEEHKRIASDEALLTAVSFYYYKVLDNDPPSLKVLYNKYYGELNKLLGLTKDRAFVTDAVTDPRTSSVTRNGFKWMRQFYEWNATTPQAVLAVNHPFLLKYDEVTIEGQIPLIREIENDKNEREIEVVIFGQSSKGAPQASKVVETDATISLKGFQEMFEVNPDKLTMYSIERGKPYSVSRTEGDLRKLESIFLSFYESIQYVSPYQRIGAHPYHGKYKKLCDTYYD